MSKNIGKEEMARHFQSLSWDCPNYDLDNGTRCRKCDAIHALISKYGTEEGIEVPAPKPFIPPEDGEEIIRAQHNTGELLYSGILADDSVHAPQPDNAPLSGPSVIPHGPTMPEATATPRHKIVGYIKHSPMEAAQIGAEYSPVVEPLSTMTDDEALDKLTLAIDRAKRWRGEHCGEKVAPMEFSRDYAALAHLRSRLAAKKVSREWVQQQVRDGWPKWGDAGWEDVDAICVDMLRELGVEVEDK